jgi:hypothetical protein
MFDPTKNTDHNLAIQITFLPEIAVCIEPGSGLFNLKHAAFVENIYIGVLD